MRGAEVGSIPRVADAECYTITYPRMTGTKNHPTHLWENKQRHIMLLMAILRFFLYIYLNLSDREK